MLTDRSDLTKGTDRGVYSHKSWRVVDLRSKLSLIEAGFGFGSVPTHMASESIAQGKVKAAIVMHVRQVDLIRALAILKENGEFLRPAISQPEGPA